MPGLSAGPHSLMRGCAHWANAPIGHCCGASPNGPQFCHIRYMCPGGVTEDHENAQLSRLEAVVLASPVPGAGNGENTFGPTEGQNEQWREANRHRQRQTNLKLRPCPPPPPPGRAPHAGGGDSKGRGALHRLQDPCITGLACCSRRLWWPELHATFRVEQHKHDPSSPW